jgi:undecaprenyl-diphosphatase
MTHLEALILGVFQGVTEFLPISSSGHLILAEHFGGVKGGGLTFDVFLHLGTLFAVLVYFWRDWWRLASGSVSGRDPFSRRLLVFLLVGTIPGALSGVLLENYVETVFRDPLRVAFMLALMSLPLVLAEKLAKHTRVLESLRLPEALFIGVAQALAVIPGTSRSGITMSAGLLVGLSREEAARFSFLLSAPIIAGAGAFEMLKLFKQGMALSGVYFTGFFGALVSGLLVIAWLLRFLRKHTFYPFVVYRLALAAVIYALVKF